MPEHHEIWRTRLHALAVATSLAAAACTGNIGEMPHHGTDMESDAADPGSPASRNDGEPAADDDTSAPEGAAETSASIFDALPQGREQWERLCARGNGDPVSRAYCAGDGPPDIGSLTALQQMLGLSFEADSYVNGRDGNPAFALTAHTPSVGVRTVSAANPRAFVFTPPLEGQPRQGRPAPNDSFVVMAYSRGEQLVELAAKGPEGPLRFFLFRYEQSCNARSGGCVPGELYTPRAESGFERHSLYEDVDIANTPIDCLACHQPQGPGTPKTLLMQQIHFPWEHFLFGDTASGGLALAQYRRVHDAYEAYGGIPGPAIDRSDPGLLQLFVENNGGVEQPVEFPGNTVGDALRGPWEDLYRSYLDGDTSFPAYPGPTVTEPDRLAEIAPLYRSVAYDDGDPALLPDLEEVLLPGALPDMTVRARSEMSGEEILRHACVQCHNDRLDPSLSRARFDATRIDELSEEQRRLAVERLRLPPSDPRHMPPVLFRELSEPEKRRAIESLGH